MSIKSMMPSNHLILCCPCLLPPSIFPSIRIFSNESVLHMRWTEYWSFSFSISPSNEHSRLISFRIDWLALLAVQGLSRVFSNTTVQKHQFFRARFQYPSYICVRYYPPCICELVKLTKTHSAGVTFPILQRGRAQKCSNVWNVNDSDFDLDLSDSKALNTAYHSPLISIRSRSQASSPLLGMYPDAVLSHLSRVWLFRPRGL